MTAIVPPAIDRAYLLETLASLLEIPSPTGMTDAAVMFVCRQLDQLGIHSLELTEIVFDLEEAYGIEIEMNTVEAWNKLKNVGDIVEATRALIAAKG